MSNQIHKYQSKGNFTTVCNLPIVELSPLALGVFVKILRLHNAELERISKGYIENLTGLSPDTVTKVLSELRYKGYAIMYRKKDKKTGKFDTKYEFSEYPSDKYKKAHFNFKIRKKKETEQMIRTQKAKGNYHFNKFRHLPPSERPQARAAHVTDTNQPQVLNITKGFLKDLQTAAKPAARKYLEPKQESKIIEKYSFIHKAMIIYDYFLYKYHNQPNMVWTSSHGKRFVNIIEEIAERITAATTKQATEKQVLIQLSFMLSCVMEEHKLKNHPEKFFPGLLHHNFIDNWKNYQAKRKNYYNRGILDAPPFVLEYLEEEPILNETQKLLGL